MNTSQQRKATGHYRLAPDEYRRVLAGMQLSSLELVACNMGRPLGQSIEGRAIKAVFQEDAQLLSPHPAGFEALHSYKLTGHVDDDKVVFDLEATYLLVFSSEELIGEEFFEIFKDLNLAVHTWPFFRELVSSMTSRTSLPTLTLPLRITG